MANDLPQQHALTCDQAVAIVRGELQARGWSETHRVAALRSAPVLWSVGGGFGGFVVGRHEASCQSACAYKLLISDNGGVTCQLCASRNGSRPRPVRRA
jgi:hypothetical protein